MVRACVLGDAPVCDPKTGYECVRPRQIEYIQNDEESKCNCARQCTRLTYAYTISQATFSSFLINFAKVVNQMNQTEQEIRFDYCGLEVRYSKVHLYSKLFKHSTIRSSDVTCVL